ncbi:hypothetical protein K788_0001778 (plasmid) [Paraburkholderia caribensis MBA4]|uniref:Uncharacterized protein n=1 Tax=Paraburkholderia caribensis MBA4 TaxID=1323664 RepID=A0A0N7JWA0_9BURK|nr:hypothetical protein K788_0001778 [Paraburkholderia caribensis MBA4]
MIPGNGRAIARVIGRTIRTQRASGESALERANVSRVFSKALRL